MSTNLVFWGRLLTFARTHLFVFACICEQKLAFRGAAQAPPGAKNVYMVSAAPEIRFPNVYGIDMPSANELIAHGREVDEICKQIGADALLFQDLSDLVDAVGCGNREIERFETSVFNAHYVTGDVDQNYLEYLESLRGDDAKKDHEAQNVASLDIYNEEI